LTTSSISCARSSWRRRASALVLALTATVSGTATAAERGRGGDIEQAWFKLAQGLDRPAADLLRERTDEILQAAARSDVKRLTPLALALVAQSRTLGPTQAEAMLVQAARLDSGSAEPWFALAELRLRRGNLVSGFPALGRGLFDLLTDRRMRGLMAFTGLLAGLVVALAAFTIWGLFSVRRVLPRLWHDLTELGSQWRLGANSVLLGVLILALPLFAGGDPVWLLLWMFTLAWAYLPVGQRVVGAAGFLLVAASPTLLEIGFRTVTHPRNVVLQATEVLEDRRYEPQILDELNPLADVLGEDPDYHRLVGDCYRQFGLLDQAVVAYREGLRTAPHNSALSLALGTVYYLEGDYNAALRAFQAAKENKYDPVIANYDLSLTYAQNYHFHESDEAMAAARLAGERRLAALSQARDHDIIAPAFSVEEARAMLAAKDPLVLLNRGLAPPPLTRGRTFAHPLAIGGLLCLIVAVAHLLVRRHTGGLAAACLKCGRAYCHRCKLSTESQSYCTQCINIFLKKDMVGIDAQLAKRQQLVRRQAWLHLERRVADLLLPGVGVANAGRPFLGGILAAVAMASAATALVWLPTFVAPALMATSLWPLETLFALVWAAATVAAQLIPVEGR
jgi:tetratricopeptide (TPR) repeat protein